MSHACRAFDAPSEVTAEVRAACRYTTNSVTAATAHVMAAATAAPRILGSLTFGRRSRALRDLGGPSSARLARRRSRAGAENASIVAAGMATGILARPARRRSE